MLGLVRDARNRVVFENAPVFSDTMGLKPADKALMTNVLLSVATAEYPAAVVRSFDVRKNTDGNFVLALRMPHAVNGAPVRIGLDGCVLPLAQLYAGRLASTTVSANPGDLVIEFEVVPCDQPLQINEGVVLCNVAKKRRRLG